MDTLWFDDVRGGSELVVDAVRLAPNVYDEELFVP
jgi:hypothetical protein